MILVLILFSLLCLLGWFCYKLVYKLNFVSENMKELFIRLDEFDQHINFIYELEMYYGDETLKNLIRHSRDFRNYMKKYKEIIEAFEDGYEVIDEQQTTETEESDEENEQKTTRSGKTIFYQGP